MCRDSGLRPSQGDQVLSSHLAPNYPDIARIAGEFLLSTEPDPDDEEDEEALHHNTGLESTELRTP